MEKIRKVLLVDDEPLLCELMSSIFSLEGFEVKTACDGKLALQTFREFNPDLIISDIRMPNCDGFCLLEAVTKIKNPPPPIIIISGYGGGELSKLSKYPNVKKFFSKPLDVNELIRFIHGLPN
ncbi:MAG: response regulator [Bacteriovorax sp.]